VSLGLVSVTHANASSLQYTTESDFQAAMDSVVVNSFEEGDPVYAVFNDGIINSPNFARSGSNYLGGGSGVGSGGGQLSGVLDVAANGFGIWVGGLNSVDFGESTLNLFDTSDNLIYSVVLQSVLDERPLGYQFFGVQTQTAFGSFRVDIGSSDYVYFDDIQFGEVSAVPLPAAAWLFLSVLGGAGVMRKFGKKSA
jgi:hypothetical protein